VYTIAILYMYTFSTYSDNWHCDTIANIKGPVNLSILNNNLDLLILQLVFYTRQWWSPKTQPSMHFNSTWGPGTRTSLNGVRGAKILPKGFTSFGRRLESVGREIFFSQARYSKKHLCCTDLCFAEFVFGLWFLNSEMHTENFKPV